MTLTAEASGTAAAQRKIDFATMLVGLDADMSVLLNVSNVENINRCGIPCFHRLRSIVSPLD